MKVEDLVRVADKYPACAESVLSELGEVNTDYCMGLEIEEVIAMIAYMQCMGVGEPGATVTRLLGSMCDSPGITFLREIDAEIIDEEHETVRLHYLAKHAGDISIGRAREIWGYDAVVAIVLLQNWHLVNDILDILRGGVA